MIQKEDFPEIPAEQRCAPWLENMVAMFQEQVRINHEQAQVIQKQAEEITSLKKTVQKLRDELNRLKKLPKRPKFRPSKDPSNTGNASTSANRSNSAPRTKPQRTKEEVLVRALDVPKGARFKGYQTYTIQELMVIPKEVTYKLEIWQASDGAIVRAFLPTAIDGSHFGPNLRTMIHALYANGMTQPAIFDFMLNVGINVSGSTKSSEGQTFRDGLMTIKQTCFRLGQSLWEYLQRLFQGDPIDLAQCVRARYRADSTAPT